jgi:hypothetical protein
VGREGGDSDMRAVGERKKSSNQHEKDIYDRKFSVLIRNRFFRLSLESNPLTEAYLHEKFN